MRICSIWKGVVASHSVSTLCKDAFGAAVRELLWPRACILGAWLAIGGGSFGAPAMKAHFINVGQAQSILLEFPCGAVLVDAGTQDGDATELTRYLDSFFDKRSDLKQTLDTVFLTHAHVDHSTGLDEIAGKYVIRNFVDSGLRDKIGGTEVRRLIATIESGARTNTFVRAVTDQEIENLEDSTGITDEHIDAVSCAMCDPKITVLSASRQANPGWPAVEFKNYNNHSLVIRVAFGDATFLFTGDLEEDGIEELVSRYQGTELLNVDVYQVGHHGSHNGTTQSLLEAMSPQAAVLSVGAWNFGRISEDTAKAFTTFAYGHPRRVTVENLARFVSGYRSNRKKVKVADAARRFSDYDVKKRIYATAWDGTVLIQATLDRKFKVTTEKQ
jgi:competence protein ComEC